MKTYNMTREEAGARIKNHNFGFIDGLQANKTQESEVEKDVEVQIADSRSDGFFGDDRDLLTQEEIENLQ